VKVQQLSHCCLGCHDLERTRAFYVDVLGLEVAHQFVNDAGELYGYIFYAGGRTWLEFFRDREPGRVDQRFRHLCFEVANLDEIAGLLRSHGFEPQVKRGKTDGTALAFVEDPEGNVIEFHEFDPACMQARFLALKEKQVT
jgi:catechol 2,3-dioxygenase-like lactoylglutathione lyase family enzyme